MAVIRTEHLSHVYSEGTPFVKMAIQDVNLSIEEGEMVGVIGHTGSGKSTLIEANLRKNLHRWGRYVGGQGKAARNPL